MINGIYNAQQLQALKDVTFGQPTIVNNYYSVKAETPDNYQGKTLKTVATVAGIAAALLFHKNIAAFIQKYAPKLYEWFGDKIGKPINSFSTKHADNFFIKKASAGKNTLAEWSNTIINFFKSVKNK